MSISTSDNVSSTGTTASALQAISSNAIEGQGEGGRGEKGWRVKIYEGTRAALNNSRECEHLARSPFTYHESHMDKHRETVMPGTARSGACIEVFAW